MKYFTLIKLSCKKGIFHEEFYIDGPFVIFLCQGSNVTGQKISNDFPLLGDRFLTFNIVIRVNQIEAARNKNIGQDERALPTPERVIKFRNAIAAISVCQHPLGFELAGITRHFCQL